jgi:hypothetical protein
MSDKPAKPSIPSWQRATPPPSPPSSVEEDSTEEESQSAAESPVDIPKEAETTLESPSLLDQASKFLKDPTIRDAPQGRKVAFLESKGVTKENIVKLLGESEEKKSTLSVAAMGQQSSPKVCAVSYPHASHIPASSLCTRDRYRRSCHHGNTIYLLL